MAKNTYLSAIESKPNEANKKNRDRIMDKEVARWEGRGGDWAKR